MVAKRLVERRRQLTEQHTARTAAEAARVQPAMETEGEAGADDADVHVEIERKALGLLRMQRALRSNIISCEQGRNGRLATKTLRNDNTRVAHQVSKLKVKLEEKEKNLRRREETRWLTHLMDHRKLFFDFHREVCTQASCWACKLCPPGNVSVYAQICPFCFVCAGQCKPATHCEQRDCIA
jgi:hypothetical protein